jgi:hypothetical protein
MQGRTVFWSSSTFWYCPGDILCWDLNIAEFAVDTVLVRSQWSIKDSNICTDLCIDDKFLLRMTVAMLYGVYQYL